MSFNTFFILAAAAVALTGCQAHDPYSPAADFADDGRCEDALAALVPAAPGVPSTTSSDMMLEVIGGVAVGVASEQRPGDANLGEGAIADGVWRDAPDFTELSRTLRLVAGCYEERGDKKSLVKAFVQLEQIVESPIYDGCREDERERVDARLERVEGKLKEIGSDYVQEVELKNAELATIKAGASSSRTGH